MVEQTSDDITAASEGSASDLQGDAGSRMEYFDRTRLQVAHHQDGGLADHGWAGMLPTYQPFMAHLNGERHGSVNDCLVMTRVWQ